MAQRPQREPPGGRGLALAGPGMHDQQAAAGGFRRNLGILHGFALFHLRLVARSFALAARRDHSSFSTMGRPATMNTTRFAIAATA